MKKLLSLTAIKIVVLSVAAVVLTVNIYSVTRINDINKSFSTRQNEATWFVFQLVKEYANFLMVSRSETIDLLAKAHCFSIKSRFAVISGPDVI